MNNIIILSYAIFLISLYWLLNTPSKNFPESKNKDFFKPTKFFIIFTALEIPYAFSVNYDHNLIPFDALKHINDFDSVFFEHFANTILFTTMVMLAVAITNPKLGWFAKLVDPNVKSKNTLLITHIFLLAITAVSFYLFLRSIGGLYYLLLNVDSKTNIIAGTGYLQALYTTSAFMGAGFLIMYFAEKNTVSKLNIAYFLLIVIIIFLMLSTLGSRKSPILFLVYVFILWNYKIRKIRLLTFRNSIIIFLGLIYFSAIPLFRTAGAFAYYSNNLNQLFFDSLNTMGVFFQRFSELERSLMIYSLFDSSNLWLGSSFKDILYAPLPRGMFPDKPPVDEGVYLYNIAHGRIVHPSTPLKDMIAVGWPPNTITNMYMNFWYLGVIIGGWVYGYFLKYFYKLAKNSNFDAVSVYLYTGVIFGSFGLTNRNIVGFLTTIIFTILIVKFVTFISKVRP